LLKGSKKEINAGSTPAPDLKLYDLTTYEIPPYNIWEAAYRLQQTMTCNSGEIRHNFLFAYLK
jgi:S-adenosylmethionine hydrolase